MRLKRRLEDYTELEFLLFLYEIFSNPQGLEGDDLNDYMDKLIEQFEDITEHPGKSDVLFYPKEGQEDSPEGVLKEIKEWRAQNGKPGFKSP
ncbi:Colicin-E2 immunity protein [compost metagenome]